MEKILLSYDVNGEWNAVRDALVKLKYSPTTLKMVAMKTCDLPNTTMLHRQKTKSQAIDDIKSVCRNLNIRLEKAVSVVVLGDEECYNG